MWKQFHNNIHTIIKNIKIKKNAKKYKKKTNSYLNFIMDFGWEEKEKANNRKKK